MSWYLSSKPSVSRRLFVLLTSAFRLALNSCCLAVTAELGFLPLQQCTLASHPFPKLVCCMLGPRYTIHPFHASQCPFRQSVRTLVSGPSFSLMLVSITYSHSPAMWEPAISMWSSIKQSGCTGWLQNASTGMAYPQHLH